MDLLAAPATLAIIATNIVVSVVAFGNVRLLDSMLFDVGRIRRNHEYHRMVTSGFIHGDPFHLFINMYSLYIFGPFLESGVGTWAFLTIYLVSLLVGSLWSFMEHYRETHYRALGASGAVSGVTTATAMFAPFSTILAFFILPMPLIVFAGCYIVWSAYAAASRVRDGIGHAAHLGGALAGLAMVCIFWPGAVRLFWTQFVDTLPF